MASMLLAREVPPTGGDTLFANMYLAYEALSPGMKQLLDGMVAVNSSAKANVTRTREDRIKSDGGEAPKEFVAEHPVVRTHPETGRKAPHRALPRHDRGGERAAPPVPVRAPDPARVHLPLLLAAGLDSALGQPLRAAQPGQRLSRLPARDAPDHLAGRSTAMKLVMLCSALLLLGACKATQWPVSKPGASSEQTQKDINDCENRARGFMKGRAASGRDQRFTGSDAAKMRIAHAGEEVLSRLVEAR
jgi:hypothetical protein